MWAFEPGEKNSLQIKQQRWIAFRRSKHQPRCFDVNQPMLFKDIYYKANRRTCWADVGKVGSTLGIFGLNGIGSFTGKLSNGWTQIPAITASGSHVQMGAPIQSEEKNKEPWQTEFLVDAQLQAALRFQGLCGCLLHLVVGCCLSFMVPWLFGCAGTAFKGLSNGTPSARIWD